MSEDQAAIPTKGREPVKSDENCAVEDFTDSTEPLTSTCDRVTNVVAVFLLFAILITSIISIAAGASCLASVSGKPFKSFGIFVGFGVAPVVIGCLALVAVVLVIGFISMCAMGLRNYGMCFYGTTRCRGALRVCLLGVFPFLAFLVLLAMCILGFTFFSLSQQLPPLSKDYIEVSGISGPVTIVRDENGLTHIQANSRRDAYFGQGFAEAQDRLFQLEFHRLVAYGQLSSKVGKTGIKTDSSIRYLNIRDAAYAMCEAADAASRDFYQAFADGVNLYLERVSKRPVEFFFMSTRPLFFHDPEPFSAADMCATSRLYQWQMSSNVNAEGSRFTVWAGTNRTYAEVGELFPDFTAQPNTILSQEQMLKLLVDETSTGDLESVTGTQQDTETLMKENDEKLANSTKIEGAVYDYFLSMIRSQLTGSSSSSSSIQSNPATSRTAVPADAHEVLREAVVNVMVEKFDQGPEKSVFAYKYLFASNAWAARDETGKPMVASDPHLTINLPSVWYYVHLSFPTDEGVLFDTAGVGLIGVPGVHIGKTTNMAWGITMSMTDLEDLFIFPPTAYSGLEEGTYMYDGVLRSFTDRRERIKVKGSKDTVLDVQDSLLGPIVTDMLGFPSMLKVALFAVPLQHDDNTSVRALLRLSDPTLTTAEDLVTNLLSLQAPGFSIPIADTKGNLGYAVTGKHPKRPLGHTGLFPTCAFDAADLVCRVMLTAAGSAVADSDTCDLLGVMKMISSTGASVSTGSLNLTAMMPMIRRRLSTSNWSTYISANKSVTFDSIPSSQMPHVNIPFDQKAAHISCANQKIVPQGYPYLLGSDYAWPYRGARAQELLDANAGNLSSQAVHQSIQMDHRSNFWVTDFRPIVESSAFQTGISADEVAKYWSERLLNWDAMAEIDNVETSFFWRWVQRMAILPRDATKATSSTTWTPTRRYITTMLTSPTTRMKNECADYMSDWESASPCLDFAVKCFKDQAAAGGKSFSERWGRDLNRIVTTHEMLDGKSIHPIFQRTINKAGDTTSLAVSSNTMDSVMTSKHASSMRLLYDLWNSTEYVYFALPGGNSGNPYSKYYQNMLEKFEKEEYVHVVAKKSAWDSIDVHHSQTLSA